MVCWNLQSKRQKLHHTAPVQVHELAEFSGVDQRRGMTEIHEAKLAARADFAIEHGGDLLTAVRKGAAERVARGGGLGEAKIQPLEHLRSGFPAVIEFGEHQGLECVVNSRSN